MYSAPRETPNHYYSTVPGTEIPCGSGLVTFAPHIRSESEIQEYFDSSHTASHANMRVSGVFVLKGLTYRPNVNAGRGDGLFLLPLEVGCQASCSCLWENVSAAEDAGGMVVLNGVPDVLRSLQRDLLPFQVPRAAVHHQDKYAVYNRLVEVAPTDTVRGVLDALSEAEGWAPGRANCHLEISGAISPDMTIQEVVDRAATTDYSDIEEEMEREAGEDLMLVVRWPYQDSAPTVG